mmetsp:Transcript_10702/g.30188  ORF Transcript_10702/g.30188 Transcript_10702/m.30188 type:complete len:286 (+) Transcript_10702:469-1326(+)
MRPCSSRSTSSRHACTCSFARLCSADRALPEGSGLGSTGPGLGLALAFALAAGACSTCSASGSLALPRPLPTPFLPCRRGLACGSPAGSPAETSSFFSRNSALKTSKRRLTSAAVASSLLAIACSSSVCMAVYLSAALPDKPFWPTAGRRLGTGSSKCRPGVSRGSKSGFVASSRARGALGAGSALGPFAALEEEEPPGPSWTASISRRSSTARSKSSARRACSSSSRSPRSCSPALGTARVPAAAAAAAFLRRASSFALASSAFSSAISTSRSCSRLLSAFASS